MDCGEGASAAIASIVAAPPVDDDSGHRGGGDNVCFSSIDPIRTPTHTGAFYPPPVGTTFVSRARGGMRTNQVHARVRLAPVVVGCAEGVPSSLSHSSRFAQTFRQYTFSLPFAFRSQLPIIYCTYFGCLFPNPLRPRYHDHHRHRYLLTVALIPNPPNPNPSFLPPFSWYLIRATLK